MEPAFFSKGYLRMWCLMFAVTSFSYIFQVFLFLAAALDVLLISSYWIPTNLCLFFRKFSQVCSLISILSKSTPRSLQSLEPQLFCAGWLPVAAYLLPGPFLSAFPNRGKEGVFLSQMKARKRGSLRSIRQFCYLSAAHCSPATAALKFSETGR